MPKYLPHGTTFRINSKLVGGLISITLPDASRGEAESTDSASGGDREFLPGLRDGGSVELTFRHDPDDLGQQELQDNFAAAGSTAVQDCLITLPDASTAGAGGATYAFNGFVTAPPQGELGLTDDEVGELSATIKVTGIITITPT